MNALVHIDEFRKLLASYSLSPAALHNLSQTELVLLIAATSSGRNTILRELMRTGDYHYIVSDTTRKPRINDGVLEQNGVEYWFRSEEEVLQDVKEGKFLEAAILHNQQVSGISVRELEAAAKEDKIAITDADVVGADNATKHKPDTIVIFILPPSFEDWQHRLHHRGDMDPAEFKRRMQSAADEFRHALSRDYYKFVINDTVQAAAQKVNAIAKYQAVDEESQHQARDLANQLLIATEALLRTL